MKRFEIEEIVTQDKNGIVFRAHDAETGATVALRRFFPFGQEGGGLEEEEAIAFGIASQRLSALRHESLRAVIMGSVDPIDGIPYIATEWIEGASLKSLMGGQPLDPALVIDVLRIAIETSIVLSHILGEEAVWVETEVESIVVGSEESGKGFTFWISPFKWLGGQFESRKLSSIVKLGEDLAGWKGKVVGDQAGYGLGAWLKWLKANPDTGLHEALETLAATTGNQPPPPVEDLVAQATEGEQAKLKVPSTATPVMLAAGLALLVAVAALVYFHVTAKVPSVPPVYAEQGISDVIADPAGSKATPATKPPARANEDAQIPSARINELAKKFAQEAEAHYKKAPPVNAQITVAPRTLTPDDAELISTIRNGTSVKVRGVLRTIDLSNSGKTLFFEFSDPRNLGQIRVATNPKANSAPPTKQEFAALIGKTVEIDGKVIRANWNDLPMVQIDSKDQVTVVK